MGHAASVSTVPPTAVAALRAASTRTTHAAHAAAQQTQRWLALVDERVLSRVHRAVETHVLVRVRRAADELEVASKLWFVKSISTTTIADAFDIAIEDVHHIEISKRVYEVYNCGPELRNVPTLSTAAATPRVLELRDSQIAAFLLCQCLWTTWKPPTSWRMKADQVFDLSVHVRTRRDGFLTGAVRVVRLRAGKKWVGPHHHNASTRDAELSHASRTQWLHRVDYETNASARTAASAFFATVELAWKNYVFELSQLPAEDLRSSDETGGGGGAFAYDAQDRATHLRVKYLLETSLVRILSDTGTLFRAAHAFELWRMAQEDDVRHRSENSSESHFAGPLLDAHIDELAQLYELQAMELEDVKILELPSSGSDSEDEEDEADAKAVSGPQKDASSSG